MKNLCFLMILLFSFTRAGILLADKVALPPLALTQDGPGGVDYPFTNPDDRALQRFSSTAFLLPVNTFMNIESLAFRLDSSFSHGSRDYVIPELTVDLSSTFAGFSRNFDATHGSNRTRVFDGPLRINVPGTIGDNKPAPFNIVIPFKTPFAYDPKSGDLVFDIHFKSGLGGVSTKLDFFPEPNLSNYALYTQPGGISAHSGGLATEIVYSLLVVPEPTTSVFITLACGLFVLFKKGRTK